MSIYRLDLLGKRFGRLIAVESVGPNKHKQIVWRCMCDCGNETFVTATQLKQGVVRSCGCLRRDTTRANKTVHGHRYERLYGIWKNMNKRCNNSSDAAYDRYGGRGINVCDAWKNSYEDFRDWSFSHGYSDDLSIDRINNDDGYFPENCRWVDGFTQMNNTRRSRYIEYNGLIHTIAEWARLFGVNRSTLRNHIILGNMSEFEKYFQKKGGQL